MEEINLDSVDFGGGIELLMNNKKEKKTSDVNLDDELKDLDLNDLEEPKEFTKFSAFSEPIQIAKETSNLDTTNVFKHMDDINVEKEAPKVDKMSKEEMLREKFMYLRKLEALQELSLIHI